MVYASKNETYFGEFKNEKDKVKECIHMQIKMFIPENGHPEKKTGRVLMSVLRPK